MSGWDEGATFYSDQQYEGGGDEVDPAALNRYQVQRRLKEFIRSFHDPQDHDAFIYRDKLQRASDGVLQISTEDLQGKENEIMDKLRTNPADILPLMEAAAAEVASSLQPLEMGQHGEMEEPRGKAVQVLLFNQEPPMAIRSLSAAHISKLVKVPGIVIGASKTKSKATTITVMCKNCHTVKLVSCRLGLGGITLPRTCDHVPQVSNEPPCPLDPWEVVTEKSIYVDQQTLKLQENPEDVPTGEMPRNLLLAVERSLVQRIVPGTRITVIGIYSIFQASDNKNKGAVALRQPYLRVVGMDQSGDGSTRGSPNFTHEEELEFKEFARGAEPYKELCSRISPSIFGHEDVKKAIACLLFGGARKHLPDGVRLRGDINVLLIGDPSTAKSQFLKFVEKTAPIAVYTSGKGSSAAGLTASVIRDATSREFYLEGGAMVLADGGVVCIDEFDKMRPEDRVAIHEAMEQQTISIAKAGITTVLNSRTAVLAAANPPSGRYDDLKSAQENIDLQTTILSRFDLIFIVRDVKDHARDMEIARHVVRVHASAGNVGSDDPRAKQDENWLKRYIEFCRSRCAPRLSARAADVLQNNYVRIRQQMRKQTAESGEASPIPITVRQLEAIVRLSESLARMQLSAVATEEHVAEALRLFNVSTLDAAQSGLTDSLAVSEEQRAEIQQVEAHVRRRMGIGSVLSERALITELVRANLAESTIRRAVLIMVARGEMEHRSGGRVLFRKS